MGLWVLYKNEGIPLVGRLLSTKGSTYVHVSRVFEHRIRRTSVLGAFASEERALSAMREVRDDPQAFLLRAELASLEGYVALPPPGSAVPQDHDDESDESAQGPSGP